MILTTGVQQPPEVASCLFNTKVTKSTKDTKQKTVYCCEPPKPAPTYLLQNFVSFETFVTFVLKNERTKNMKHEDKPVEAATTIAFGDAMDLNSV